MSDTITPAKGLTQPAVGADDNTWGGLLDNDLTLIDTAFGGTASVSISGNTTLTTAQIQNTGYKVTGTLSAAATITWPSFFGFAAIENNTTGGFSVSCGISGGTFVPIFNGESASIWSDGTNFAKMTAVGGGHGTTGSGAVVLANSPTINSPIISITATGGTSPAALSARFGHMLNAVDDFGADPTGGTDSTTAMQNAFNASATQPIYIPPGTYHVSQVAVSGYSATIIGAGLNTVLMGTNATDNVVVVNNGIVGYYLGHFVVDRLVQATDGAGVYVNPDADGTLEYITSQNQYVGFVLGATARSTCNYCVAQSNYRDGFQFSNISSNVALQWLLNAPLSQFNNGWGYNIYLNSSPIATDPEFHFPNSYANSSGGFIFSGNSGTYHNDLIMEFPVSSSDGGPGIDFENPGTNIQIISPFIELAGVVATGRGQATAASHVGAGIFFEDSGLTSGFVNITGGILRNNSFQGLVDTTSSTFMKLTITGLQAVDNGQAGSLNAIGIDLQNTTTIYTLSGVSAFNSSGTSQQIGIRANNASNVYIAGGDFTGNASAAYSATTGTFNAAAVNGI